MSTTKYNTNFAKKSTLGHGIINSMATEETYSKSGKYQIPFPTDASPVDVTGDIKRLVDKLENILPPLGVSYFEIAVRNETGSAILAGTPVYATGSTSDGLGENIKTKIAKSTPDQAKPILGLTKTQLGNNSDGIVVVAGVLEGINTSAFLAGDVLYVAIGGGLTNVKPSGSGAAIGIVGHTGSTNGIVIVQAKGNGTWGALASGLS